MEPIAKEFYLIEFHQIINKKSVLKYAVEISYKEAMHKRIMLSRCANIEDVNMFKLTYGSDYKYQVENDVGNYFE